jgi:hypothetical protein
MYSIEGRAVLLGIDELIEDMIELITGRKQIEWTRRDWLLAAVITSIIILVIALVTMPP